MIYGIISVKTIMVAGKVAKSFVVHEESLPIHTDIEAAEIFFNMLEAYKRGELINPGIQVEVYPDTNKIKRVVKCWTEVKR
jgi:hypothetical protein